MHGGSLLPSGTSMSMEKLSLDKSFSSPPLPLQLHAISSRFKNIAELQCSLGKLKQQQQKRTCSVKMICLR